MVCPACGGDHSSEGCPQPGTANPITLPLTEPELPLDQTATEILAGNGAESSSVAKQSSRLIEFPGVTRRTIPPWRKELSERVRELQERRAHEAAAEAEATERQRAEHGNMPTPQLELLPPAEVLAANPLVAAALRRIERAHQPVAPDTQQSYPVSVSAAAGATDNRAARTTATRNIIAEQPVAIGTTFDDQHTDRHKSDIQGATTTNCAAAEISMPAQNFIPLSEPEPATERATNPERGVNLVMVPAVRAAAKSDASSAQTSTEKPKPKRVISDDSTDPALNYLDKISGTHSLTATPNRCAPVFLRFLAGVIDILGVCFLSVPFAVLIELRNENWREPRIVGLMALAVIAVMFIYLTVSTALTGKTLGLRITSLRVIDARTGLIPTGKQATGRAIVYILSLATAGLGFLMALARGEGRTVHDRLSGTLVVRNQG